MVQQMYKYVGNVSVPSKLLNYVLLKYKIYLIQYVLQGIIILTLYL